MEVKNNRKSYLFFSLLLLGVVVIFLIVRHQRLPKYIFNEGKAHGTYYHATYLQPQGIDLQKKLEERMHEIDLSMSTFHPQSIISRINRNDDAVRTDIYFETMFETAQKVSEQTKGAFDITVAPLVNAWGFGFGNENRKQTPNIDSIMPFIGYKKISLKQHRLLKTDKRIMLDASAIAKGFSSDMAAKVLEENGCKNYLVEIGGEIVCKGKNPKGEKWKIGIDKPIDDSTNTVNEIQTIVSLTDKAMATSGNYRQYYYRNGKKFSHTIDPRTGYPVNNNVLSATVIAPSCIVADAYATAFMVLGVDSSLLICKSLPDIDCYLIYSDKNGKNRVIFTEGFKKYLTE
jgi:thiamine biosynthesis lipoprotein